MSQSKSATDSMSFIAKAREYEAEDRADVALMILEGALNSFPNEIRLLEEYIGTYLACQADVVPGDRAERLGSLLGFAKFRLASAAIDSIDPLISIIDQLAADYQAAQQSSTSSDGLCDSEQEYWQAVKSGKSLGDAIISCSAEELDKMAAMLESVLEKTVENEADRAARQIVQDDLGTVRVCQELDTAVSEAESLIEACKKAELSLRGYILQQADQILRNYATTAMKLGGIKHNSYLKVLQLLESESNSNAREERATEARRIHQKPADDLGEAIRKARNNLNQINGSLPDKSIQTRLDMLRDPVRHLSECLPLISGTEYSDKAAKQLLEAQTTLLDLLQRQQKRYDLWALATIRSGYKYALNHISTVLPDNEAKIAIQLIKYFGEIDVRLLSPDIHRSYSEVFELLFERLNKPKKDEKKDYDDKGSKLYTLKEMMEKPKKSLSDF